MNYVEVAVPFFVLAMGIEFVYGWATGRQTYRLNDALSSLQLGTLSQLNRVLHLGVSAAVLGGLASLVGVPQWSMDAAWQWALAFVAYDFLYYWKHRFGHEWSIAWASHVVHHQSEEFNLSTALRQTGTDYLGFVFYLPLYFVGIPATALITVGSLNLIYQFWVHTEHIRRLGPLEWVLVTPSNHRVHHARNPEYIDKNYGGVFIVWDRLFGTFKDEDPARSCVFGITTGLKSFNPLWANFHFWFETARMACRTRSWADKLKVWFKAPGWTPADLQVAKSDNWQYPKYDPNTAPFMKVYAFVQFWLLLGASLWLQSADESLPRAFALMIFAWLCFSFYGQGVCLEGRAFGQRLEWLRLAATGPIAIVAWWLGGTAGQAASGFAIYGAASAAIFAMEGLLSPVRRFT